MPEHPIDDEDENDFEGEQGPDDFDEEDEAILNEIDSQQEPTDEA